MKNAGLMLVHAMTVLLVWGGSSPLVAEEENTVQKLAPIQRSLQNNLGFAQEKSGDRTLAAINYQISCSMGCRVGCRNQKRLGAMAGSN